MPEINIGDTVIINCQPACEGEGKWHGIRPIVNKLKGTVEATEIGYVGDHFYSVRFYGPAWAQFELRPGTGIPQYFKASELTPVLGESIGPAL